VVGLLYFWFIFGGSDAFSGEPRDPSPLPGLIRTVGPLLLAFYAAAAWIFGKADALAFRPAEVHLLFAGPLTRRDLLRYKLLHAQVPLLFTSTFVTLATYGATLPWWLRFPSVWVLFATLQLHQMAAALVHEAARQQGLISWRRNWLPITVFGGRWRTRHFARACLYRGPRCPDFAAGMAILGEDAARACAGRGARPFRWVLAPLPVARASGRLLSRLRRRCCCCTHLCARTDTAFEESAAAAGSDMTPSPPRRCAAGGGWRSYARAQAGSGEAEGRAGGLPAGGGRPARNGAGVEEPDAGPAQHVAQHACAGAGRAWCSRSCSGGRRHRRRSAAAGRYHCADLRRGARGRGPLWMRNDLHRPALAGCCAPFH
jgi:hypothetical protein